MVTICLQCGSEAWDTAFIYCVKCLNFAVHRYCLPVVPETFDEFIPWVCDDCVAEAMGSAHENSLGKTDGDPCTSRLNISQVSVEVENGIDRNQTVLGSRRDAPLAGDYPPFIGKKVYNNSCHMVNEPKKQGCQSCTFQQLHGSEKVEAVAVNSPSRTNLNKETAICTSIPLVQEATTLCKRVEVGGVLEDVQIKAREQQSDIVIWRTEEPQACTVDMIAPVAAGSQEASILPKKDLENNSPEGSRNSEGSQTSYSGTLSIGTSCLKMVDTFEEEGELSVDNSNTTVGLYKVDSSVAPLLQAIMNKYGDIARGSCMPTSISSLVLEKFCKTIKKFEEIKFTDMHSRDLESLKVALEQAESVGLDVEWLRKRHHELKEAMDGIRKYSKVRDELEDTKSSKDDLQSKRDELMKLQLEYKSLESQLLQLEAEARQIESDLNSVKPQCKYADSNSLVDDLL